MRTPATRRRSTSPAPTGSTGRRDPYDSEPAPVIRADFALRHAGQLATMMPRPDDPLGRINDGALAAHGGRVAWIGDDRDVEAQTGYGLDLDHEAKSLEVLRQLAEQTRLRVIPTFLGAHTVPPGVDRRAYVRSLIDEMLPAFRPWAVFCDAWCEASAFTAAEVRAVLGRAKELGYAIRVHAAQLAPGEGPDIAAELGARSADHLEFATPAQINALAKAGTVAVLCPGANFTTHGPRPPIEAMREAKLAIAIASDLNPGPSNSESLPLAMSLACVQWGMTPAEALAGATVHAAHSLN